MENRMTDAQKKDLAREYASAVCGEFEKLRPLLHDDLVFNGPLEAFATADAFVETVKRHLGPIGRGAKFKREMVAGDTVVLSYDFVTNTPAGLIPITEWIEIAGEK